MTIIRTDDFLRASRDLPQDIQKLCTVQLDRFEVNDRDPRLHSKKLRGLPNVFSIRVTRRYRAFFYFQDSTTAIFFDIDHRKDAYR